MKPEANVHFIPDMQNEAFDVIRGGSEVPPGKYTIWVSGIGCVRDAEFMGSEFVHDIEYLAWLKGDTPFWTMWAYTMLHR
jgi:hypothetical protein